MSSENYTDKINFENYKDQVKIYKNYMHKDQNKDLMKTYNSYRN